MDAYTIVSEMLVKSFENRSILARVVIKNLVSCVFWDNIVLYAYMFVLKNSNFRLTNCEHKM